MGIMEKKNVLFSASLISRDKEFKSVLFFIIKETERLLTLTWKGAIRAVDSISRMKLIYDTIESSSQNFQFSC